MHRRDFVKTTLASASAAALGAPAAAEAAAPGDRHVYELRNYELRNDLDTGRVSRFFQEAFLPAAGRAGLGPVGAFTVDFGLPMPALILLLDYPSIEGYAEISGRLAADSALQAASKEFEAGSGMPYVRYDSTLLRAFSSHPRIESRPANDQRPARLFELRTYEAPNTAGLASKLDMFNREEIAIFRKTGFSPVFFGEALFGERLPHLTYMVAFDDMAARTKAWDAFRTDPDWIRIRDQPGWANRDTVSAQRLGFLRPTSFSQIR
jgi:hypothetical protein